MVTRTFKNVIFLDWNRFKTRFLANGANLCIQYVQAPPNDDYIIRYSEDAVMIYTEVSNTSPRNTEQIDWEDNYLADANSVCFQRRRIWDGTNEVAVVKDEDDVYRLAVENLPKRRPQPVRQYDSYSNNNTKASYTVPTGKVLYIVYVWISYGDDANGEIVCELQDNGSGIGSLSIERGGGQNQAMLNPPESVPFGSFSAGRTIRIERVDGDNDEWAGGWHGYLEDI